MGVTGAMGVGGQRVAVGWLWQEGWGRSWSAAGMWVELLRGCRRRRRQEQEGRREMRARPVGSTAMVVSGARVEHLSFI